MSPHPEDLLSGQNWPAYEAGLKRRGDLTLWLDETALARWQAPRRTTRTAVYTIYDPRYPDAVQRRVGTMALCVIKAFFVQYNQLCGRKFKPLQP